jgi:hypothetical protein
LKIPNTYEKLEEFIYSSKRKTFRRKTKTWYLKECKNCNDEYFGEKDSIFCSISCSNSFRENPNKGKKIHSEESKRKMSESRKGKNNPFYGKYHTEKLINSYKERFKGNNNPNWKGGYNNKDLPYYNTYAHKIDWIDKVRKSPKDINILEVKCTYCGKWFTPTRDQINRRCESLESRGRATERSENRLYCSKSCKNECPIYRQRKYPKGYKKATSREVQPELRQLVLKRDNYTCQKCGNTEYLHCHHIKTVADDPIESADIDNCTTLCKKCHIQVHKKDGCKYGQLRECI